MKINKSMILLASLAFTSASIADDIASTTDDTEYRVNIGLFTEHYLGRSSELNENNQMIQISAAKNKKVLTAASFLNSYFQQSYLIGYGYEETFFGKLRVGGYISAVHGYEGYLETTYGGFLIATGVKVDAYGFTLNILPAVYSVGYEFEF